MAVALVVQRTDTNGYELLAALRRALDRPALPAFLCTAEDEALVAEPARLAGFAGCWTKPVDLQTVLAELSRRSANAAPGPAA